MGHTELLKGLLTLHVGAVDIRICYFCCCYFSSKTAASNISRGVCF